MLFRCFITALWLMGFARAAEAQDRQLRVVSLAPNLTELVFELGFGSNLVGRSSACDFPPGVLSLPVVGGFGRPNGEMLESLRPDLVLATDLEKPGLLGRLKEMGTQTLLLPCESWDQLMQAGLAVSEAFDQRGVGEKFVHDMTARRSALERRVDVFCEEKARPRVYVEVWGDPLTTAGGESFLNDLIQLAGGTNIAVELRPEYVHVSAEWIIGRDPDVILLAYMLPNASSVESVVKRPGWDKMRAVQGNAICANIQPDLLLRPGPRMLDGAEKFAEWIMRHAAVSNEQLTTDN
jgi:iron complex transport system substrate-binding protein